MKNTAHELLEDITDPGEVFFDTPVKTIQEEEIIDVEAEEGTPSPMSHILTAFNKDPDDTGRIMFLNYLIKNQISRNNLITLILHDPKASQIIKNQLNDFSSQYSR